MSKNLITIGKLKLDKINLTAQLGKKEIYFTGKQFDLIWALARSAGKVQTREQLMEVTGAILCEHPEIVLSVHVSQIRKKLLDNHKKPRRIKTVHSTGYFLAPDSFY